MGYILNVRTSNILGLREYSFNKKLTYLTKIWHCDTHITNRLKVWCVMHSWVYVNDINWLICNTYVANFWFINPVRYFDRLFCSLVCWKYKGLVAQHKYNLHPILSSLCLYIWVSTFVWSPSFLRKVIQLKICHLTPCTPIIIVDIWSRG